MEIRVPSIVYIAGFAYGPPSSTCGGVYYVSQLVWNVVEAGFVTCLLAGVKLENLEMHKGQIKLFCLLY